MFKELTVIAVGVLASISFCFSAAAAEAPPVKRAAQPAPMVTKKEPAPTAEVTPTPASVTHRRSRATGDARGCLDLATYVAIVKCAEKFL